MALYQLVAANPFTNVPITEIPVTAIHFGKVLNDAGSLDATVDLDDPQVQALTLLQNNAVEPLATAYYVKRDGTYIWGGLLWKHVYDGPTATLDLSAREHGAYMSVRFIHQTTLWNADMSVLASAWVQQVFNDYGPPVSTSIQNTGTVATLQTYGYEQHNVADLVNAFVAMVGGYEYSFDIITDGNGNPSALFKVSYPRRGRSYNTTGVVWDAPGVLTDYAETKDGTLYVADLFVTGSGSGVTQLQHEVTVLSTTHVKTQAVDNQASLTTQALTDAYALGRSAMIGNTIPLVLTATLTSDAFFGAGVDTGDEVSFAFTDPYNGNNFLVPRRILGWDCTPATASSPDMTVLTLGDVL